MQVGLAHSLEHILDRSVGLDGLNRRGLRATADAIHAGSRYGPDAFGRYYELVFSLLGQQLDEAVEDSRHFSSLKVFDGTLRVTPLCETVLGDEAALYRRRIGADADRRYLAPPPHLSALFQARLKNALEFAEQHVPALAGEFRAIVRHVALAMAPKGVENHFDSASAYQLWGLMVLNPRFNETITDMISVLAHETAHSLLFGFAFEEALVLNSDEERFASPLRQDPRPMDGVFHATYVTARMHWAMDQLARCPDLDSKTRGHAASTLARHAANFEDGLTVVEAQGQLTETGKAIMASAKGYMAAAQEA
ncbi:MAG: aKG-HExxH-type peptide beta-hydroxylase [Alphaproteobacteria bacterium]